MAAGRPALRRLSHRSIEAADVAACGRVAFDAHRVIAELNNFPPEHPSIEFSLGLIGAKLKDPRARGWLAERDGEVVGSVFLNDFAPRQGLLWSANIRSAWLRRCRCLGNPLWHDRGVIALLEVAGQLLADVVRFAIVALRPTRIVAAENLFLRRQLAM